MEMFAASPIASVIFFGTIGFSLYALFRDQSLFNKFVLYPYAVARDKSRAYQLITSGFLHGDLMHLVFNMLTFFFFAFPLERVIGSPKFLILYLVSMVIADIPSLIKNKDNYGYRSLGASGAVSAVLFSIVMFAPWMKLYVFIIPMPAIVFAVLYLLYCQYAAKRAQDNINHDAHFWGALSGVILTILLVPGSLSSFFRALIENAPF